MQIIIIIIFPVYYQCSRILIFLLFYSTYDIIAIDLKDIKGNTYTCQAVTLQTETMSRTAVRGWIGPRRASAVGHAGAAYPASTDSARRVTVVRDLREGTFHVTLR